MGSTPGQRVTVEARLLADPCLWCWEIRDAEGALVESSWANHWAAYASRQEALTAGYLTSRRQSIWVVGRTSVSEGRRDGGQPGTPWVGAMSRYDAGHRR